MMTTTISISISISFSHTQASTSCRSTRRCRCGTTRPAATRPGRSRRSPSSPASSWCARCDQSGSTLCHCFAPFSPARPPTRTLLTLLAHHQQNKRTTSTKQTWLRVALGYHTWPQVLVGAALGASTAAGWFGWGTSSAVPALRAATAGLPALYAVTLAAVAAFAGRNVLQWRRERQSGSGGGGGVNTAVAG